MDAQAYLKKHGWRGTGHSLDVSNNGLKKPLLISKKIDVLGIGINKHDVIQGQWWMKAFDSSLKDFGTGKQSLLGNVKEHGIRRGGLYGRFVQGEGVPGTYGKEIVPSTKLEGEKKEEKEVKKEDSTAAVKKSKKKRKAEEEGDDKETATKNKKIKKQKKDDDKEARRAAKKKAKSASSEETSQASTPAVTTDSESTDRKAKKSSSSSKRKEKSLDSLPADKRKEYEDRAKEKGLSLEEYFVKRQAKNLAARKG